MAQTTTYTYDKNNRILTETTQNGEVTTTTKYTYDPNGNTIAEKRTVSAPVGSEAEKTLLKTGTPYVKLSYYNHLNQLVKVSTDKGIFKYGYNDKGLRISKTGPSGTMSYFWDGDKLIAEYKEGFGLKATYLYGVGGSQIHRKDALSGKIHYYFHNAHGDVTALTDGSGNVSTLYDYNAYGEVNVRGENIENPFKYFSQYYDEETGSYYLRARYYDPSMMRFTNEDTYQGKGEDPLSLNRYLYCTGNPVGYVDESGNVAIVPLLVYLGKTGVETIPDVLIDLFLDGGNFSAAKSFWGNFALNVIPIAGEFQTVKKLGELATKYGDEIVQGLKNIDYITKNLDAIIEFVKKEDALGLASFIKGGSTTLKGAGKSVSNMGEFFSEGFGKGLKDNLSKTNVQYQGQSIYKVTEKTGNEYLKKGYGVYLDALHKDHLEVINKAGDVIYVLNLDGTLNADKTAKALGRTVKGWK